MTTLSIAKIRLGFVAAVLVVSAFSPLSHAQDVGMAAQVNVPFAFETATGQHFNAGVYTLRMENTHTLLIKGQAVDGFAMVTVVDRAETVKAGKATFRKYGSQYFLAQITVAGKSRRIQISPSKDEKRLQNQVGTIAPAQVELALLGQTTR